MVAPTTDLGSTAFTAHKFDEYGYSYAHYYEFRRRYRQARPFTLVLPYQGEYRQVISWERSSSVSGKPADADDGILFGDVDWTGVRNKSYEKLRSKVYDKVGAGVDFAEYRQSADMIASTATTLLGAARSIKSLRFGDAVSALRMKFLPKGVSPFKSFANNWLEFHFGWEPLLNDIHDALEVINDPVKSFSYERGRAREPFSRFGTHIDLGSVERNWSAVGTVSCTQGCRVMRSDLGVSHTLDQWGISTPLSLAWELVPYSFVVDWFVNVGDFLSSQSDFAGLTLTNTFQTLHYDILQQDVLTTQPNFSPIWRSGSKIRFVNTVRSTSLSGIALEVKRVKLPSLVRGATAISLLVGFLGR